MHVVFFAIQAGLLACVALAGCAGVHPSSDVFEALSDHEIRNLVSDGRSEFLHCNSCHALAADAPPPFGNDNGPHLEDLIGRTGAVIEGFAYTPELIAADLTWDIATLDQWLERPEEPVRGLCQPFAGIADADQRLALIAYLAFPDYR